MASAIFVLVCVSIPVVAFSYRPSSVAVSVKKGSSLLSAESVHWRRRLQHAGCGLAVASSYKWVIRDAYTGEKAAMVTIIVYAFYEHL